MKGFGRIITTLFILAYFDDMPLRQRRVEKQLNQVENANWFFRAFCVIHRHRFNFFSCIS
jgi:TnpA family transposase